MKKRIQRLLDAIRALWALPRRVRELEKWAARAHVVIEDTSVASAGLPSNGREGWSVADFPPPQIPHTSA